MASTTGKEFSIELSVAPPYEMDCEALWFFVEVDGHCVDIPILMKSQYDAAKRRGVGVLSTTVTRPEGSELLTETYFLLFRLPGRIRF